MKSSKILIIDDEPQIRTLLQKILSLEGYIVITAENSRKALELLKQHGISVVVTDVRLPDINGIELTKIIKSNYKDTEVIVLTAYGQIKDGVESMRNGAFDYLIKGDDDDKMPLVVARAYERAMLNSKINYLEQRIESKYSFSRIIGKSKKISEVIELAKKVAPTDTTVLILGETGTGKELFAQAIHNASKRRGKKFVAINCSAIPRDLQESELFGYKKGAFTGAIADKKGLFEESNGGTIFLDEIGDMSLETQAKLLRTLETKIYTRLGDTKEFELDIRIIAATNQDLEAEIEKGRFRLDLFYRLNTFVIALPSLRERTDDIEILVKYFVDYYGKKLEKKTDSVSNGFVDKLKKYPFYGNIRELKNIIERAVILAPGTEITEENIPAESDIEPLASAHHDHSGNARPLEQIEKEYIIKILNQYGGNKAGAAKALGIGTVTLYRKLKEYGIK